MLIQTNDNGIMRTIYHIQVNDNGILQELREVVTNDNGIIRTLFATSTEETELFMEFENPTGTYVDIDVIFSDTSFAVESGTFFEYGLGRGRVEMFFDDNYYHDFTIVDIPPGTWFDIYVYPHFGHFQWTSDDSGYIDGSVSVSGYTHVR